jgi:hypothetical protein
MKKINLLTQEKINQNILLFKNGLTSMKDEGRKPWARYASFDYCFNYFQGFKEKREIANKDNIQNSCLHLAFYLASWGMLRGSSFLLQKSIKFYEPLVRYISRKHEDFWDIDVNNYSKNNNLEKLTCCSDEIKKILSYDSKRRHRVSDTLVTKIMLGVFGNVPAFDQYFKIASGLNTFNKSSLLAISHFYEHANYAEIISREAKKTKTYEYQDSVSGKRSYTKAKIIDMIFFIEGYKRRR